MDLRSVLMNERSSNGKREIEEWNVRSVQLFVGKAGSYRKVRELLDWGEEEGRSEKAVCY